MPCHKPRISVIMAVYNCEEYVGDAIRSVQAQTVDDWELICVDDRSRDRSALIIAECAERDQRIRLFQNDSNMGAPRTRNVALEHAHGEFIAVLDSDDLAMPRRFESSLAAFDDDEQLGVVSGMWDVIDADGDFITAPPGGMLTDDDLRQALLYERNRLFHSATTIRRELMERIGGYDVTLPAAQDYDLFLRLLPHCRFLRLDEKLLRYRYRKGSISQDKALAQRLYAEFARERARACIEGRPFSEEQELDQIRQLLSDDHGRSPRAARHLDNAALVALYWGEPPRARELLRSARRYSPLSARLWLSWMLTYLPQPVVSLLGDMRKLLLRRRA